MADTSSRGSNEMPLECTALCELNNDQRLARRHKSGHASRISSYFCQLVPYKAKPYYNTYIHQTIRKSDSTMLHASLSAHCNSHTCWGSETSAYDLFNTDFECWNSNKDNTIQDTCMSHVRLTWGQPVMLSYENVRNFVDTYLSRPLLSFVSKASSQTL